MNRSTPREGLSPLVMTIGHSSRTVEEFIRLLQAHNVSCVVDVRIIPPSRHNAQFNNDTLPQLLKEEGIGYLHMPGLGGLRHAKADSHNRGWRNASFRGFADYMQTPILWACGNQGTKRHRETNVNLLVTLCGRRGHQGKMICYHRNGSILYGVSFSVPGP